LETTKETILRELYLRYTAYENLIGRMDRDKELRLILKSKQSELADIINLLED
jgi:hypothetical protein